VAVALLAQLIALVAMGPPPAYACESARSSTAITALNTGQGTQSAPTPAISAIDSSRLPVELAQLSAEEVARIARMSPLPPLPSDPTNRFADDERAAELGHLLFFDTRLSPKGVSCATCHDPERHFTDGKPLAVGVGTARRNAPTVVDSARRRWIGWDGKFDSLWSQALAPIEHPDEMGGSRGRLLEVVSADDTLRGAYEAAFGPYPTLADDHTVANVLKALGAYQRRLLSGDAPIDRFVRALKSGDECRGSGA
jgi:cytochrome c peroxidase